MKANRRFREDPEAVSPVVGVILMVAITVVLAAVVFVLVNTLGRGHEAIPLVGMHPDTARSRLLLESADPGHNWDEFDFKVDKALRFTLNAQATTGSTALAPGIPAPAGTSAQAVSGGDYFSLCGDGGPQTSVTVQIVHTDSNTQVYTTLFQQIPACA